MTENEHRIQRRESKIMRIGDLLDFPLNPKNHPQEQLDILQASIETSGKFDNPKAYYSKENGGALTLFHGHGRKKLNPDDIWEVDIYVDYTDQDAANAILTGDPSAAYSETDAVKLKALMDEINTDNPVLQQMFADLAAKNEMFNTASYLPDALETFEDEPEESNRIIVVYKDQREFEFLKDKLGIDGKKVLYTVKELMESD